MVDMDKDSMPVLILVVIVFIAGFIFIKSQTGSQQTAEVPPDTNLQNSTSNKESGDQNNVMGTTNAPAKTEKEFGLDESKKYYAVLHTTDGDIKIELNAKQTPMTANNFITLAKKKFYDGTIFHRTIKGFMIQGGDPKGNGTGGPGYTFEDEPFEGSYTRGTVAMANAGPDTNGSQFFIMHADYDLPPSYTIFGKVIEGIEVVDKIATAPTQTGGEGSTPVTPVKVTTAEIIEE
jgi:cyclophilin family peptidyl-prolyl cis-trans isomerase